MSLPLKDCSKCGTSLQPVYYDLFRRQTDFPQMRDALVLEIVSGYGMFIDKPRTAVMLCSDCATKLFETEPWLREWLNTYAGNITYERK